MRCLVFAWDARDARASTRARVRRMITVASRASRRGVKEEYRTSPIQRPTMTRLAREPRVRDYYFAVHEYEPDRVNRGVRIVDERRPRDV